MKGGDSTELMWERSLGPSRPSASSQMEGLALTTSEYGEIFAAAVQSDPQGEVETLIVLAYGSEGELLWQRDSTFRGHILDAELAANGEELAVAVAVDDAVSSGHHEVQVFDIVDGTPTWSIPGRSQTFGGRRVGLAWQDGGLVVTGSVDYGLQHAGSTSGIVVAAYDHGRNAPRWMWTYAEESGSTTGDDVVVGSEGNVSVAGELSGQSWLGRFSSDGALVWEFRLPAEESWSKTWLSQDANGRLYLVHDARVHVFDGRGAPIEDHPFTALAPTSRMVWGDSRVATAGEEAARDQVRVFLGDGSQTAAFSRLDSEWLQLARAVVWHPDGGLAVLGETIEEGDSRTVALSRIGVDEGSAPGPSRSR